MAHATLRVLVVAAVACALLESVHGLPRPGPAPRPAPAPGAAPAPAPGLVPAPGAPARVQAVEAAEGQEAGGDLKTAASHGYGYGGWGYGGGWGGYGYGGYPYGGYGWGYPYGRVYSYAHHGYPLDYGWGYGYPFY